MTTAKQIREAFGERFGQIAGVALLDEHWIGLAETTAMRNAFFQLVKIPRHDSCKVFAPRNGFGIVHAVIRWLVKRYGDKVGVMFHCHDQISGAIRCRLSDVLATFPDMWQLVREDLCFATEDMSFGVVVELNHFDMLNRSVPVGTFEVTAWGFCLSSDDADMAGCNLGELGIIPDLANPDRD